MVRYGAPALHEGLPAENWLIRVPCSPSGGDCGQWEPSDAVEKEEREDAIGSLRADGAAAGQVNHSRLPPWPIGSVMAITPGRTSGSKNLSRTAGYVALICILGFFAFIYLLAYITQGRVESGTARRIGEVPYVGARLEALGLRPEGQLQYAARRGYRVTWVAISGTMRVEDFERFTQEAGLDVEPQMTESQAEGLTHGFGQDLREFAGRKHSSFAMTFEPGDIRAENWGGKIVGLSKMGYRRRDERFMVELVGPLLDLAKKRDTHE